MRRLFTPVVAAAALACLAAPANAHHGSLDAWGDPEAQSRLFVLDPGLEQATIDLGHGDAAFGQLFAEAVERTDYHALSIDSQAPHAALYLQLAHAGGMAADECHRDRKAGERHWHLDTTTERGGACKRHNGKTVRLGHPVDDPPKSLVQIDAVEFAALVSERDRLRGELGTARTVQERQAAQIDDLGREVRRIADALEDAQGIAAHAQTERDLAMMDAAAAEARAAGHGPAVSPRCMRGVRAALQKGRFGWGGGAKKALRVACLE